MLLRLTIRDFVLVDRLELDFLRGFGTLTGETGAGKSILIDALSFVLGERADAGLIRAGRERAEVVAEFDVTELPSLQRRLQENELNATSELILRRVVDAGGRSRAMVNGTPVTLQQLREISDELVDIHGQHAHQSLLRPDAQREILDSFGGHRELAREVAELWRACKEAENRLEQARTGGEALARQRELLEWEIGELERLDLRPAEWETLNAEQARLAHAANLIDGAQSSLVALADGDTAGATALAQASSRLKTLQDFDERLTEVIELIAAAEANVAEAVSALRRYVDRVEVDPRRLDEIDRRIESILSVARKFRLAPEALDEALASRCERLASVAAAYDLDGLGQGVVEAQAAYRRRAEALSAGRRETAATLSARVSERIAELSLGGSAFEVMLAPEAQATAHGLERVEFRIRVGGGDSRALAKVASGGELSRISLALQVVASKASTVPTLIFDEVDVGIGGGVAEVVGRLLKSLGRDRQVLCVTHLPQVAAKADWQWRVQKNSRGEQLVSEVLALESGQRVEEIARMLGGVEITELTRRHAEEMLAAQ